VHKAVSHFVTSCYSCGEELLAPRPTPNLEDHPLSTATNAYSMYSQLPYMFGGSLLHPQPHDAPCHGDRDPHNHFLPLRSKYSPQLPFLRHLQFMFWLSCERPSFSTDKSIVLYIITFTKEIS